MKNSDPTLKPEGQQKITDEQAEKIIKSIYKRIAEELNKDKVKYFDLIEQITNDLNQIGF